MTDERQAETDPVFFDALFHRKRKHGKWDVVDAPQLEALVADTHAHLQLLDDPALALARCAANGVGFVCTISDVHEDGSTTYDKLDAWKHEGAVDTAKIVHRC
ncbi:nitrate ABC transporter substrate-binding protein [Gordonibacter massiliensis (ex Traore et al. 2017)]|uniref:Nitrate ABC transporter substrate-binding protein n=1 Tax=Gordonibacter massiliensis (ex Traore et al. 2017) TaxID=1841863 RepID=A0A842J8N2_9ACTN|nr:nitrate ABC transporter substrate-binding protein [Gordonibacter massiliensis (ex Traore et al. 2017)]